MFYKRLKNRLYEIDDSPCSCGCEDVSYVVKQRIREQGASDRCIVKSVISEELESASCPKCSLHFLIKEVEE